MKKKKKLKITCAEDVREFDARMRKKKKKKDKDKNSIQDISKHDAYMLIKIGEAIDSGKIKKEDRYDYVAKYASIHCLEHLRWRAQIVLDSHEEQYKSNIEAMEDYEANPEHEIDVEACEKFNIFNESVISATKEIIEQIDAAIAKYKKV